MQITVSNILSENKENCKTCSKNKKSGYTFHKAPPKNPGKLESILYLSVSLTNKYVRE